MSEINSLQNTNYLILGKNFFTQISNLCKTSYHRHEFVEFVYVVSGNCMHLYNGEKEKIKIGDAYLFRPKKDVHGFISESSDPITHRDLIFGVDFFQKLCSALSPNLYQDFLDGEYALKMTLSNEQIFQLENLAELRLKTENSDMYERALGFYVINLMISNKSHNAENAAPLWLKQLLNEFSRPGALKASLNGILNSYSYNKSYMCRIFKKHTGVTMTEYYCRKRIEYAYLLISTTDMSITAIRQDLGFSDNTYFYKQFKQYFGTTPNSLRTAVKSTQ